MTQGEVAQAVGVSTQAVYGWERGLSSPSVANVVRLESLFRTARGRLLLVLAYPEEIS
jgi:predicted transcriptional regulator